MWSFISRFIELLLLFLIARSVITTVSRLFSGPRTAQHIPPVRQTPSEMPSAGVFKKDPVCETYIQVPSQWAKRVGDDTVYFCSKECRDRFRV